MAEHHGFSPSHSGWSRRWTWRRTRNWLFVAFAAIGAWTAIGWLDWLLGQFVPHEEVSLVSSVVLLLIVTGEIVAPPKLFVGHSPAASFDPRCRLQAGFKFVVAEQHNIECPCFCRSVLEHRRARHHPGRSRR